MKFKSIIFDFDGTIANTIPDNKKIAEVFNKVAKDFGIKKTINEKDVEKFRENNLFNIIKELKIPFFKLPFIVLRIQKEIKEDLEKAEIIKGMKDVIRELKSKGYSLSIITSSKKEIVEDFLKRHDLNIFSAIHSEKNLFGKWRAINNFLKKYSFPRDSVIYVGDEIRDIIAAKKSQIKIASVSWGFNNKKGLSLHAPDFIIETPKKFMKIFERFS